MISRQQFTAYVKNPAFPEENMARLLDDLTERFPYCQSAQTLLTYCLNKTDHQRFTVHVRKCAAYAGNRRVLKELIEKEITEPLPEPLQSFPVPETPSEITEVPAEESMTYTWEFDQPEESMADQDTGHEGPGSEKFSPDELLAIVRHRLEEIEAEAKKRREQPAMTESPIPYPFKSAARKSKQEIIDKFITESPVISKPQPGFFKPSDHAASNPFEDDDIISETLAMLYAQQGNVSRAIGIYEKLSLLNQEKSRYFAAQIEKLKHNP